MPYHDSDRQKSWDLLERHADRKDPWIGVAKSERTPVSAILCIAVEDYAKTELDRTFVCSLRKGDVLVLFNSDYPDALPVVFELTVEGAEDKWMLKRNGEPFAGIYEELLPRKESGWFAKKPGIMPIFFKIKRLAGTVQDHLRVQLQVVVGADRVNKVVKARRKKKIGRDNADLLTTVDLDCGLTHEVS